MPETNPQLVDTPTNRPTNRRQFLRDASLAATAMVTRKLQPASAWAQASQPVSATAPVNVPHSDSSPDYQIEITEIQWELAPRKKIRTAAYNGQIPGQLLRMSEGKPVTIDIVNRLDRPEIVHWHGQWIPSDVDGSMEEGSPMIAPGSSTRVTFTPRPWASTGITPMAWPSAATTTACTPASSE